MTWGGNQISRLVDFFAALFVFPHFTCLPFEAGNYPGAVRDWFRDFMTHIQRSKNFSDTSPSWPVRAWVKAGMVHAAAGCGPGHVQSAPALGVMLVREDDVRPTGERILDPSLSVMTGSLTMPDPSFAAQLAVDLSEDDLRHVLLVFGRDVARLTGVLRDAVTAQDAIGFRRAAHGLAGAAGAVGAMKLERQCRLAMATPNLDAQGLDARGLDLVSDQVALTEALTAIEMLANDAMQELARFVAGLDAQG